MKIMTKKINFKITIEETAERHPVPVLGTDYKVKIIYKNIKVYYSPICLIICFDFGLFSQIYGIFFMQNP